MEPSKNAVSVRTTRLNNLLLGKCRSAKEKANLLTREGLFDALQVLYDECNSEYLKGSDKNIAAFVDRYRKTVVELKQLRVNVSDFEVKNVVGRGHFGEVHVVRERQTGDVYAMKTVRKYECVAFDEERNIMAAAVSPWLTKLRYAFQDNGNLYFVMEYHPGGDLLGLLYRQGGTLPESAATFYIAELAVAINDVHQMGFVHRDIKPDNVLLDRCGHLKLADFGSAARLNTKGLVDAGSLPVGTPDYIAPEALLSVETRTKDGGSYGKSCDYWSLGVLAFELIVGSTPFHSNNTTTTYSKIMNHAKSLKFPPDVLITQAYASFVKGLVADRADRIDYDRIVVHPLFKNVDFATLRDSVPPYVPKIASVDDTSNFSDVKSKKKTPNIDNFKTKTQFSGRNLPFVGFTYTVEPVECGERYGQVVVKDEAVEEMRKEVEGLRKRLAKSGGLEREKEALERKLEERARKVQSVEGVRDRLECDLAKSIAECQALKRTLDMERKDRSELELKALELIKSAKLKWQATEKIKLDNLNRELEEYKEKNDGLVAQINQLNVQLQDALQVSDKHKVSVENMEKLRRSSVMGLESRLEKVTSDTQNKITILQTRLNEETQRRAELEAELRDSKNAHSATQTDLELARKIGDDLKSKVREYESVVGNLKGDLSERCEDVDQYKEVVLKLEAQLEDLRADAARADAEVETSAVLRKQIKDLKGELNAMRAAKLTQGEEREAETRRLENELRRVEGEKNELGFKCRELQMNLKGKEEKVDGLERLLRKLQDDLGRLENGSEREGVLQEQVERLEQQLVEVSENAALEKQELMTAKSKLWRVEKDLTNAELDKKIVERDLRESRSDAEKLRAEIERLNESIVTSKKSGESAALELGRLNDSLHDEIGRLRANVATLEAKVERDQSREVEFERRIETLKATVESKEFGICQLLMDLDAAKKERDGIEGTAREVRRERDDLVGEVERVKAEKRAVEGELEKCRRELDNTLLNHKALREACVLLEDQLVEFETILDCCEQKRQSLQAEVQNLTAELSQHRELVQSARKSANEEKSLRLLAETKCRRYVDDIENLQKELDSYRGECGEFKSYSASLAEELGSAERKIIGYDVTIKSLERQIDDYIAENNYLKEENSERLTYINGVKESNYNLGQSLTEAKANIKALVGRLNDLEAVLSEKTQLYTERELKWEATIQQQTKLIDFLQSKVEESNKKKKTLSDKLFGGAKKENMPPHSVALNYKDLEVQLAREREERRKLQQEVMRLKSEAYASCEDALKRDTLKHVRLQDEVLSQIVQSPASQKNDLYRQNSVQRMHHNIPHRFDTKLCTKSSKCAHCSNQIQLGRSASVCRECHVVAHTNCSGSMPRTCGLPTAYANHYSESLSKANGAESKRDDVPKSVAEKVNIEGWVKVPIANSGWEKHYACLTDSTLSIYNEPPNNQAVVPLQSLKLHPENEHGKVVLEPLASELGVPVANSDLPFVIKVETSPNSTCWPSQCIVFMTLSIEDKEKWFKGLYSIFQSGEKYNGDVILSDTEDLELNCLAELNVDTKLFGTESGLYSSLKKAKLVHIAGPTKVYEICSVNAISTVLMIVDESRVLASCDLNHLSNLTQYSQCSKPTLKFKTVNVNGLSGFHTLRTSDFVHTTTACVATQRQLVLLKYDVARKEFATLRVLDTAEPTGCVLFTRHSLLIGADKFFEVDLSTFESDEFLDASDVRLRHAVRCYKMNSFPLSVLRVAEAEYLVCFSEFAVFVDEFGRSTRSNDLTWTHLPKAFHYAAPYLYIVQFAAVEIRKLADEPVIVARLQLRNPKYLGGNDDGVFVAVDGQLRLISASILDDEASSITTGPADRSEENSDRFSFTSSMMQSLDGNLSDSDGAAAQAINRRVKFVDSTDL